MEENKKEDLKKLNERIKSLMIASFILLAFSTISFIISLNAFYNGTLRLNDYLYIIVIIITLLSSTICLWIFIKNTNKLKIIEDSIEK